MSEDIGTQLEKEGKKMRKIVKTNPWMIISLILVLLVLVIVFVPNPLTCKAISETKAGDTMVNYLNGLTGGGVELIDVEAMDELYKVNVNYQGQEIPVYMTKDGKYFLQGVDEIVSQGDSVINDTDTTPAPQPTDVPKNDKPVVELFIMSHCPYGTQAMKGMIPAARTLGDKIDFKIKFVYYAMHGEKEVLEQLNQYCIQKEQEDKYLDYLECFLKEDKGSECLTSIGIDTDKLAICTATADEEFDIITNLEDQSSWLSGRFPLFNIDLEANQAYSVAGSPTLIINGVDSNAGRDSASYLAGICNAFNQAPSECAEELSSVAPSPGFGYDTTASAGTTDAGCGA